MAMQKKQIVQAALAILDRDGLEAVTLRRLATELNVKAASIYWHIANKVRLFDEMANAILEEHFNTLDFTDDARDWAQWLDTLAHELRQALLAHTEGARVVAGAHPDVAVMLLKLWDLTIRVLHNNGFDYSKAGIITVTIINFTFGSVIEEQASPAFPPERDETEGDLLSIVETFQTMNNVMEAWKDETHDTRFDTSIRIFINGVRAELNPPSAG